MKDKIQIELEELLKEWSHAIVANDADAIGKFISDDWVIVDRPGVFTKKDFLESVRSGLLMHDSRIHVVHSVRAYGDIAILIARGKNTGKFQGEPFRNDEWSTDIFRKQNDRWICLLTHLTPAQK
jgi:ketosteroid isomerase-like protein